MVTSSKWDCRTAHTSYCSMSRWSGTTICICFLWTSLLWPVRKRQLDDFQFGHVTNLVSETIVVQVRQSAVFGLTAVFVVEQLQNCYVALHSASSDKWIQPNWELIPNSLTNLSIGIIDFYWSVKINCTFFKIIVALSVFFTCIYFYSEDGFVAMYINVNWRIANVCSWRI